MKLSKAEVKTIVNGILPNLAPGYEKTDGTEKVMGSRMIEEGQTKDEKGQPINPYLIYTRKTVIKTEMNHSRRLRKIIEDAPTHEAMVDELGRYFATFSKNKPEDVKNLVYTNPKAN